MPAKPNTNKWSDVQTAIATAAIVTTLGMWNFFSTPSKIEITKVNEPSVPPTEPPLAATPAVMPQVKIMFTQMAPQTITAQQQQPENKKKKKKKNGNNDNNGGGQSVTQTQSS